MKNQSVWKSMGRGTCRSDPWPATPMAGVMWSL